MTKENIKYGKVNSNEYLKMASALANYGEGIVRFEVNDNSVSSIDEVKLGIEKKINELIEPKPDFTVESIQKLKMVKQRMSIVLL